MQTNGQNWKAAGTSTEETSDASSATTVPIEAYVVATTPDGDTSAADKGEGTPAAETLAPLSQLCFQPPTFYDEFSVTLALGVDVVKATEKVDIAVNEAAGGGIPLSPREVTPTAALTTACEGDTRMRGCVAVHLAAVRPSVEQALAQPVNQLESEGITDITALWRGAPDDKSSLLTHVTKAQDNARTLITLLKTDRAQALQGGQPSAERQSIRRNQHETLTSTMPDLRLVYPNVNDLSALEAFSERLDRTARMLIGTFRNDLAGQHRSSGRSPRL